MKKALLILLSLFILTGCSTGAKTQLSDGNEVLITVGNEELTKDVVYDMLKMQDISATIVDLAKVTLVNSLVEVDDAIRERANVLLEENRTYFGDYFDTFVKQSFETEERFVEEQLIPAAQQEKLAREYYDANYDAIVEKQKPRQVMIITSDTTEDAQAIIDGLKAGQNPEALVEEFGNEEATTQEVIIASTSTVPADVLTFIQEGAKGDITDEAILDADYKVYYTVKILEDDPEAVKEDYFLIYVTNTANLNDVFSYYFKKHKFKVYDQDIFDMIKANKELELFYPSN